MPFRQGDLGFPCGYSLVSPGRNDDWHRLNPMKPRSKAESFIRRAYMAIRADGANYDISWEGAMQDQGMLAVLKDAPNKDKAIEFLRFMISYVLGQVHFMNKIHYAAFTQEALDQVPAEDLKFYATVPENAAKIARPDWKWIADNQDTLNNRFNQWLTK